MKVKATQIFQDLECNLHREKGEMFEVSGKRYKELLVLGLVEEIKAKEETKKE